MKSHQIVLGLAKSFSFLVAQRLIFAQVADVESGRGESAVVWQILVPALVISVFLYAHWLGVTRVVRRYRNRENWKIIRRWWPLAMALLMLPHALQDSAALSPSPTLSAIALVGVLPNVPALLPFAVLRGAFSFDFYGWAATLWPLSALLGWTIFLRVIEWLNADQAVSLDIEEPPVPRG